MRDKVPKKQKRDKKQVGTSQETRHVTSKLFESDAHVSWGQQMSNMSDPKKRRFVSWLRRLARPKVKKQIVRLVRQKSRKCFLGSIHVDFWTPRNKFRAKHGQLRCVAFSPVSSLDPKKQRLDPKKQLTGSPSRPGNGSAGSAIYQLVLIRFVRTSVGRHRQDNGPSFCTCPLGLLRCRLFAQRRASLTLLRTR